MEGITSGYGMMNDLNLYNVFYLTAKYGSVSKGAKALYISQPAVSKSIKLLEDRLEIQLFTRNSKGVTLTKDGEVLYTYVESAIKELQKGEEIIRKIKNYEIGNVKIGVSTTLGKHYFLSKLQKFILLHPKINIDIVNKSTIETLEMIIENKIEIALICQPFNSEKINFIKLKEISDIVVASKEYLDRKNIVDERDLFEKGEFILLEDKNVTRRSFNNYLRSNGYKVNNIMEASNMDFLIHSAKLGIGITTVIREFVEKELVSGELKEIKLSKELDKRAIGIAYKKDSALSAACNKLIECISK